MAFNQNRSELVLDGNNKGAVQAINGMVHKLKEGETSVKNLSGGIGSALSSIVNPTALATGAILGAAYGLKEMIGNSIDAADHLSKLSQQIGVSTESLSTLEYAAKLSNVSLDQLSNGLGKLSKNMFDVFSGVGQTAAIGFNALGISVKDATGKLRESDQVLLEVADKFSQMKDGSAKTAIAVTLFGKAGKELIPLLNQGSIGIASMQQEARKLGLEIDTNTGKMAEAFNDSLTKLKAKITGVGNSVTESLLPEMNLLSIAFDTGTDKIGSFLSMIGSAEIKMGETKISVGELWRVVEYFALQKLGLLPSKVNESKNSFAILNAELDKFGLKLTPTGLQPFLNGFASLGFAINTSTEKTKDLSKEWEKTKVSLEKDIAKNSMSEFAYQIYIAKERMIELKKQFGDKKEITDWYISSIAQITEVTTVLEAALAAYKGKFQFTMSEVVGVPKPSESPVKTYIEDSINDFSAMFDAYSEMSNRTRDLTAQNFGNMANAAAAFYQAGGQRSKAAFDLYKAMSIGQAVISTYNAAAAALSPPPVGAGPLFGPILAATTIALGLAQVAAIASTQPGSSGGGASIPSSSSVIPRSTQQSGSNSSSGDRSLIVNLYINGTMVTDGTGMDRLVRDHIVPGLNKAVGDGHKVYASEIHI